jgi:hypothetical protein
MRESMFGAVRRCVEAHLDGHPYPGLRCDRAIALDVTNRRIDGCCYLFFAEDKASPALVAKAARTAAGRSVFDIEYGNLESLVARGLNSERPAVPAPLDRRDEGGVLVTLQSALDGQLMKNLPGRRLFSAARIDSVLDLVLDWWLQFQDRFETPATRLVGEAYRRRVLEPVELFCKRYLPEADERAFLAGRFESRRVLEGLEVSLMTAHGDFCPANLMIDERGIGVFDWEFPLRHDLPLYDLFYFLSSLRYPYAGRRGESSHFESFASVFWEETRESLGDLFLLALVRVANMKYEGLLASHGLSEDGDRSDAEARARWAMFGNPEIDEPFACIRDGVFHNLSLVARRGLPEF